MKKRPIKIVPLTLWIAALVAAGYILWIIFLVVQDHNTNMNRPFQARPEQSSTLLQNIKTKVAEDAVTEYNIAKRQGDRIQICVQAGFVAAAYLQAQDELNYGLWKGIQKADCKRAGVRQ